MVPAVRHPTAPHLLPQGPLSSSSPYIYLSEQVGDAAPRTLLLSYALAIAAGCHAQLTAGRPLDARLFLRLYRLDDLDIAEELVDLPAQRLGLL